MALAGGHLLSARLSQVLDQQFVQNGGQSRHLMAAAARSAARVIARRYKPCPLAVICGPGNNGGDGLLIAHRLKRMGWGVQVFSDPVWRGRQGDAGWAQAVWNGCEDDLDAGSLKTSALIVDAAFGAGLNRPLPENLRLCFQALKAQPVVAIDVPSGMSGDDGCVAEGTPKADLTISFVRPKYGHFLLPGRGHCGDLVVADIGIDDDACDRLAPPFVRNQPELWRHAVPRRTPSSHKYAHGHAMVLGGPSGKLGASAMTAIAADRVGAGLVTLLCAPDLTGAYGQKFQEVMVRPFANPSELSSILSERRVSAIAIGPALGLTAHARACLAQVLQTGKPLVIDADAITLLGDNPLSLTDRLHDQAVLTPHDGEFVRISDAKGSRLDRAVQAAKALGCVVLLKGGDTVVAGPDGQAAITTQAPPTLATAGSGDVLSGMIAGLLAQGMEAYQAANFAVWLQAQSARRTMVESATDIFKHGQLAVLQDQLKS